MTPEEYERIKEAEKEHLRALRQLKRRARMATQTRNASRAVSDMVSSLESLLDEHREMTDRLTHNAALQEARLEVGLESARDRFADVDPANRASLSDKEKERDRHGEKARHGGGTSSLPEKTIGRMRGAP